jgi:hypothetical protein
MTEQRKPMAVVENQIEIAASPNVVWTCFTELTKWPLWFPAMTDAQWLSDDHWRVGSHFQRTIEYGFPLGKVTEGATIEELNVAPFAVWRGKLARMDALQGFRFDATQAGTLVLSRQEFYGPQAMLAKVFFVTRRINKVYQAALEGLREYVETGITKPYKVK